MIMHQMCHNPAGACQPRSSKGEDQVIHVREVKNGNCDSGFQSSSRRENFGFQDLGVGHPTGGILIGSPRFVQRFFSPLTVKGELTRR